MEANRVATIPVSDILEPVLLQEKQVDCPVLHHFGPGIYIREVFIPKGTFAVGHKQKTIHLNIFLRGKVTMINEDGSTYDLEAPMIFPSPPGRKIGYIHEDLVWLNVYATEETDVQKLEETYLEKSEVWQAVQAPLMQRTADRADFEAFLKEYGLSADIVRAESERTDDLISLPFGAYAVQTGPSEIEGIGLFATAVIRKGDVIAPARLYNKRTIAGRYTNHSMFPNAEMQRVGDDIYLVATQVINGYQGGKLGDEITVDYRQVLKVR